MKLAKQSVGIWQVSWPLLLTLLSFPALVQAGTASPNPPMAYALPLDPIRVTNGVQLADALSRPKPQDIVLADGIYDSSSYLMNACGHRLYAEHLGKAVLKMGVSIGSNWCSGGGLVRGLAFDVSDPRKTLLNGIIQVWGSAAGTKLLDVSLNGNDAINGGIMARQPEGLVLARIVASNFQGYGVLVDANVFRLTLNTPVVMEDIDASHVSRQPPRSSNGTAEACIWVGNKAIAKRLRARDCAWTGVWTGTANDGSSFSDVTIDQSPHISFGLEHYSRNLILERLEIGPNANIGVHCEWADPVWESRPACHNIIVQDSVINTTCVGVYLDYGTEETTVRRTRFLNQSWASIADYKGNGNLWDVSGNISAGTGPDQVRISHDHISLSNCR